MRRMELVLVGLLAVGALLGAALAWKAMGWRRAVADLKAGARDYAGIGVYPAKNDELRASRVKPDVVFLGASHTLDWGDLEARFPGWTIVNRGVGGQLVPQYLLRFRQDVIDLQPRTVVIEGCVINATYDVPVRTLVDSYASMAELARLHGIEPILATTVPGSTDLEARIPGTHARVREINQAVRSLCRERGFLLVDYQQAVAPGDEPLAASGSKDGVHVGQDTYDRMAGALEPVLRGVLASAPSVPIGG